MSVATGISPAELVELDGPMFDALVEATDGRWSTELELAAEQVELTSALLAMYVRVHTSAKRRSTLEPLQVERPAWVREAASSSSVASSGAAIGALELAELVGKPIEAAR